MTPYDGTPTIKQTCRSSGRPATLFCRSARHPSETLAGKETNSWMSRIFDVSCDGYPASDVSPVFPFCPPPPCVLVLWLLRQNKATDPEIPSP